MSYTSIKTAVDNGVKSFLQKRQPNSPGKVSKDLPAGFPWWKTPEYR